MRIGPGETFGDLEILEEIGKGAFATVFLARDKLIQRTVALKVMRFAPAAAGEVERKIARREARLAGRISSPHIVTVYHLHDLGEEGWVVEMEHIDGPTLNDILEEQGKLPVEETLRIMRGVLMGLHAAHEHRIIHRDVKPGNVLLGKNGSIKLTDFGLSRTVGDDTMSVSSLDGFMGTPQYVAPEIIEGATATMAADLWSVSVIAYRALTGRLPFDGESLPDLFDAIRRSEPAPMNGDVPAPLAAAILSGLSKDPADRPRSAAHLLAALEDATPT